MGFAVGDAERPGDGGAAQGTEGEGDDLNDTLGWGRGPSVSEGSGSGLLGGRDSGGLGGLGGDSASGDFGIDAREQGGGDGVKASQEGRGRRQTLSGREGEVDGGVIEQGGGVRSGERERMSLVNKSGEVRLAGGQGTIEGDELGLEQPGGRQGGVVIGGEGRGQLFSQQMGLDRRERRKDVRESCLRTEGAGASSIEVLQIDGVGARAQGGNLGAGVERVESNGGQRGQA